MEFIRGQVESVRPLRDTWGRVVVFHGSDRERATVMGTVLGLTAGDTVVAEGQWTNHPRWGAQFKAREIKVVAPSDAAGAIEWMRGRLPGIGRKLATEITERWPIPQLWEVLGAELAPGERSPLEVVRGVNNRRAHEIYAAYREHRAERDLMVGLKGFGLTDGQCAQLVASYGESVIETIRRDPYALIADLHGWGWKKADALALRMGLPADHPGRLRACLEWMLGEEQGRGNVCVPAAKLVALVMRELSSPVPVPAAAVRRAANDLLDGERVVLRQRGDGVVDAYRAPMAVAEEGVASCVLRLLGVDSAGAVAPATEGSEAA